MLRNARILSPEPQQTPGASGSAEVVLIRFGESYMGGPYRDRIAKAAEGTAADASKQPSHAGKSKSVDATSAAKSITLRELIISLESTLDAICAENHALQRDKGSLELQLQSQEEKLELRIDAERAKVFAEHQNRLQAKCQGLPRALRYDQPGHDTSAGSAAVWLGMPRCTPSYLEHHARQWNWH
eukprot:6210455-Pleurochrysis_carterae.AAC.2